MFQDFDTNLGSSSCPINVYKITLSEGSSLMDPTPRSKEVDHSGPHQSGCPHLSQPSAYTSDGPVVSSDLSGTARSRQEINFWCSCECPSHVLLRSGPALTGKGNNTKGSSNFGKRRESG